jgi:hypothetical protein
MSLKRAREARERKVARLIKKSRMTRSSTGVVMSTGGVAGSGIVRVPKAMPTPTEVKWFEAGFNAPPAGTAGAWTLLNNNIVPSVVQGITSNTRVGKNIRIVGCVYRMSVNYQDAVLNSGTGVPYTVDFVWDKKPLNSSASIQEIYDSAGAGGSVLGNILPNANQETRFSWQKRIERAPQDVISSVNGSFKCNKFVSYSGNDGTISTVEQNNLLVVFGHSAIEQTNRANLLGRIRIVFSLLLSIRSNTLIGVSVRLWELAHTSLRGQSLTT